VTFDRFDTEKSFFLQQLCPGTDKGVEVLLTVKLFVIDSWCISFSSMEPTKLQNEDLKEQVSNVSASHPSETAGMRRDNESIDDFEHLEPESSPVKEFQGQGPQNKMDKVPSQEGYVASSASQNTSDFSFLPAGELESAMDGKNNTQFGDGKLNLSPVTLSDSAVPLMGGNDFVKSRELDKTSSSQQPQDPLDFSTEAFVKPEVDSLISAGEKLGSKFESEFDIGKIRDQKILSQAFMDTEREDTTEGLSGHKDIPGKFTADVDFLKSETKPTDIPELNVGNLPSENYPTDDFGPSLSRDIGKYHDDFQDSGALWKQSDSGIKPKEMSSDETGFSKSSVCAQEDDFRSQVEPEPEVRPTPVVITEPNVKLIPNAPEPTKPTAVVPEPSLNPEIAADVEPNIKPLPDKPGMKSAPQVCILKTKSEVVDSDLEEIKPIQLFLYMGLGKSIMHLFQTC
jgi:hypothetical protein